MPAKTLGSAAAAGTMRDRSGPYSLACSTAAVNTRPDLGGLPRVTFNPWRAFAWTADRHEIVTAIQ